jgi:hypothetical protein
MKRNENMLELEPSPTNVFLTREELAIRWKRAPLTLDRLVRKFNLPVYRLTTKGHLFALRDIEAVEAASRVKPPKVPRSAYKKQTEVAK